MALADLLVKIGADIGGFKTAMQDVSQTLDQVGKESSKAFKGFDQLSGKLTSMGTSLTAAITLPLVGAGFALGKVAVEFDEAMDRIRAGTGATGTVLESLGVSFRTALAEVPNSAKDVAVVIADLNSRLGLTGPVLETLATQMLNLARVTGSDVAPLIAASTRLFGDWSVATADQSAAMDYLFRVSQNTGIGVQRLTELVVQFGAPLRALGFSLEEGAALMGKWEKEGVNLETVLSGLKFALGNFAKAGKEPQEALQQVIASIQQAKTESEATSIAFQTFGKRAAVDMARAIIEGRLTIDEFVASLKAGTETINTAAKDTLSFTERMQHLGNQAAIAVEPIGIKLVGALESFMGHAKPLLGVVSGLVDGFTKLPTPVQDTTIAFLAALAALGPLTIGAGMLVRAITDVAKAYVFLAGVSSTTLLPAIANIVVAVQSNMIGALTSGEMALLRFGQAGIIVATAFAAWKLGEWAYQNIPAVRDLGDEIATVMMLMPGFQLRMLAIGKEGMGALVEGIKRAEEQLRSHGVTVDRGSLSLEQYALTLEQQLRLLPSYEAAHNKAGVSVISHATAVDAAAKHTAALAASQASLEKALQESEGELARVRRGYELGYVAISTLEAAEKKLLDITLKLNPEWAKHKIHADAATVAWGKGQAQFANLTMTAGEGRTMIEGLTRDFFEDEAATMRASGAYLSADDRLAALVQTFEDATPSLKTLTDAQRDFLEITNLIIPAVKAQNAAQEQGWKDAATLGLPNLEELGKRLDEANAAYDRLANEGFKSARQEMEAHAAVLKAQIDYYREIGRGTGELERDLGKLNDALGEHSSTWTAMGKQVSTIINDMGRSIADSFLDLFRSNNDALAKQAQQVLSELARETSAYEQHASDLRSLFEETTQANQDELDKQLADLAESLDEKTAAYEERRGDLRARFEEITQANRESLDRQLADLQEHLADKTLSYQRSIEDINKTFEQRTGDNKEDLEDKERDYKQYIEGQQLKLKQLEGDNSTSAKKQREDILLALKHRAEDMDDYRGDIQAKQRELEEDQRASLARETADYAAQQADILAKQREATADYTAELAKRESDLRTALDRQAADYEKQRSDILEKQREITDNYTTELAKRDADLAAALSDAAAQYEQYKIDNAAKLKEIEDQHKSVLDRIGDMFKGVFTSAGEALTRFIAEELVGKLFKELRELADKILPSVADALGKVFGVGGGSVPGGIPGVPNLNPPPTFPGPPGGTSGGAGGTGGALGGLTGLFTAIGSIGSMISGIIGNFQSAKQETTLNAIEHSTRYTSIATIEGGSESIFEFTRNSMQELQGIHAYQQGQGHNDLVDIWSELQAGTTATLREIRDILAVNLVPANISLAPAMGPSSFRIYLDGRELLQSIVTVSEESGTRSANY